MPNISAHDLVLAIQAVDCEIADLERTLENSPPADDSELESLLVAYRHTARRLERAYRDAEGEGDDLPPYDKLVRRCH